ncbi:hypothetical protein [Sphingomonas sp. UBA978]|jgi:hypothetical protein|uniref:hypothetical protein n=1 Tax=Sphingomonas sp. UBA978 TaxID=1947536 RepID=UPI0025D5C611|nr:hypothetical protein [Sphingomonas sp. UBA978]
MTNGEPTQESDNIEYLRQREADERAAAEDAACMARTAHDDLADEYADRAEAERQAEAQANAECTRLLTEIDKVGRA